MFGWLKKRMRPVPPTPPIAYPAITAEMKSNGLTWAKTVSGDFIEVCEFCGGNCGQCGLTSRIGNVPFDLDRMAKNIGVS